MTALHGENFSISKLVYLCQNLGDGFSTVCVVKFDGFSSIHLTLPVEKDGLGVSSAFLLVVPAFCVSAFVRVTSKRPLFRKFEDVSFTKALEK